ncbi:MAG: DUF4340 domain-containing protein [Reinekea sp.]|jgi:hypothetical protein
MKKLQSWLGVLLVAQLILAGGLFWNANLAHADNQPQPLLSFSDDQVNKAIISADGDRVTLNKVDDQWQLADSSLPIDQSKWQQLLERLQNLETGWPVANSQSSQQRFEVADDQFQRHVELFNADKKLADLYLGTSPGFREVHVRRADDNNIYNATLATHEFPVDDKSWLNRQLLAVKDIKTISRSDYKLEKTDSGWQLDNDTQQNIAVNEDKAKALENALQNLSILDIAKDEQAQNATEVSVISDNQQWSYKFLKQDDKYFVSRNDLNTVFTISKETYNSIIDIDEPQLAASPQQDEADKTASDSDQG